MSGPMTDLDAAWTDFADRVKAAGESITGDAFPSDPRMRAEGYRYVGRLTSLAHQLYLEFGDTERPSLFRYGDDITPFGATNTDNNYCRAFVDPAGTYRLSGEVTGVKELLVSLHDGEFVFGHTAVLAEVALDQLEIDADGRLDLVLGGPSGPTNWLPLPDEATYVNIRQFVADWERDAVATLHIERLDDVPPLTNVTPESVARALDQAATWVETSVGFWNEYSEGLRLFTPTNAMSPPNRPEGAAVNMVLGGGRWELDPGQALVIEFDEPDGTYWSIQTYMLSWLQPLDFIHRVTSLNDAQAQVDDDGKVRVVVAHDDPGVQNWLDTSGLPDGLVSYRWVRSTTQPTPTATVVDLGAVSTRLPRSTPRFSAKDRQAQLDARRRGVDRRFRR